MVKKLQESAAIRKSFDTQTVADEKIKKANRHIVAAETIQKPTKGRKNFDDPTYTITSKLTVPINFTNYFQTAPPILGTYSNILFSGITTILGFQHPNDTSFLLP